MAGCMDSCWTAIKNGTYGSWARWLAVSNVILEFAVPILCLVTDRTLPVVTFVLLILFSILTGTIELPICCSCFTCCVWIQQKMAWFKNFILRAVLYAIVSAVLLVVSVMVDHSPAGWYFGIANAINVFLYLLAQCQGEKPGDAAADEGIARDKAKEKIKQQAAVALGAAAKDPDVQKAAKKAAMDAASDPEVQGLMVNKAKENPELAAEALRAAAKAAARV